MWFLHLLAAFGCFCLVTGINNGVVVPASDHKYVVYIMSSSMLIDYDCTGGIIHEQYILTAAHCFTGGKFIFKRLRTEYPKYKNRVVHIYPGVDSRKKLSGATRTVAKEIYFTKQYFVDGLDDIAIVKLDSPLILGFNLQKLRLPLKSDETKVNGRTREYGVVAGYGRDPENDKKNKANKGKLKKSYVRFTGSVSRESYGVVDIKNTFTIAYQISSNRKSFSQGTKPLGTCQGDSGSPILLMNTYGNTYEKTNTVVAVVSKGFDCDSRNIPTLDMNVAHYVDSFIKPIIEERNLDETLIVKKDSKPDSCINRFLG